MSIENPENKKVHPNAEYRGRRVEQTKEVEGITLKLDLQFDSREPDKWGTHPITLWVSPVIHQTFIEDVNKLREIAFSLTGPLSDPIKSALDELKLGLGSMRPNSLETEFSDHEKSFRQTK